MSYDITLNDPVTHEPLTVEAPHQMRGGTYAMSGTNEMWLNITYNYGFWFRKEYAFGRTASAAFTVCQGPRVFRS